MGKVINEQMAMVINQLWERGVVSSEIQEMYGLKAATLSQHVKRKGIKRPDGVSARTNLVICSEGKFRCSKCDQEKITDDFQKNNVGNYYGYCRDCRSNADLQRRVNNPDVWLSNKLSQYKHRAKVEGLLYNIDSEYIKWLYEKQQARCFYSDYPLHWGHNPQSKWLATSVDKVVPEKGYVKGNVVLAQTRINSAKSDFSLEEMKRWMPEWYGRIVKCSWIKVDTHNWIERGSSSICPFVCTDCGALSGSDQAAQHCGEYRPRNATSYDRSINGF